MCDESYKERKHKVAHRVMEKAEKMESQEVTAMNEVRVAYISDSDERSDSNV